MSAHYVVFPCSEEQAVQLFSEVGWEIYQEITEYYVVGEWYLKA